MEITEFHCGPNCKHDAELSDSEREERMRLYMGSDGKLWEQPRFTLDYFMDTESEKQLIAGGACCSQELVASQQAWRSGWVVQLPSDIDGVRNFTLEKSPSYMETQLYPLVAARVNRWLPNVKLLFTVCDPAERLYSE